MQRPQCLPRGSLQHHRLRRNCSRARRASSLELNFTVPHSRWAEVRYRGCGRYLGRLRPRRPGPDLSLGTSLLFACGRGRGCGQQDCNQHHERLLRAGRNNEGHCFCTGNEGSGEFLFRPSGRRANVSTSPTQAACFLRFFEARRSKPPCRL